ncbi:MAG: tyrosine-type recombinase/integrase [Methylobacter sp.]
MAHIRKYQKADGTTIYKAEIVVKKDGMVIHRESKTFHKQKLARDWAFRREVELQETAVYGRRDSLPVGNVIEQYINAFKPEGRTKSLDLANLLKRDIAKIDIHTLNAKDLIKHIRERNQECKPQTAANDLIWLKTVLKTMRGVIDFDIDLSIFDSAREVLRSEGLIAKSEHRERRPTRAELWALSRHFSGTPMLHVMWFALYSARRQSEITRLEWDDINHDDKTCMLRDMKHPRLKGVKKRFKLPVSAYKVVMRQPQTSRFVFPMNSKTIGAYFTRACKLLNIKDLHFHDLRHEATSRLFERGLSIVQVQQVTLHSSWDTLQLYVNLKPGDVDI